jgi:hypothetical protein
VRCAIEVQSGLIERGSRGHARQMDAAN